MEVLTEKPLQEGTNCVIFAYPSSPKSGWILVEHGHDKKHFPALDHWASVVLKLSPSLPSGFQLVCSVYSNDSWVYGGYIELPNFHQLFGFVSRLPPVPMDNRHVGGYPIFSFRHPFYCEPRIYKPTWLIGGTNWNSNVSLFWLGLAIWGWQNPLVSSHVCHGKSQVLMVHVW